MRKVLGSSDSRNDGKEEKKIIFVPGKLILIGEHFVINGAKGIGLKYSYGIELEYKKYNSRDSEEKEEKKPHSSQVKKVVSMEGDELDINPTQHICKIIEKYRITERHEIYNLKFQIPYGSGLGTSAATAIGFALAMELPEETIFDAINEAENFVHGGASGIDAATILFQGDGVIFYDDMITSIVLPAPLEIILIDTNSSSRTDENIEKSRDFQMKNPVRYAEMIEITNRNVERLKSVFESEGLIYRIDGQQQRPYESSDNSAQFKIEDRSTEVFDEIIKETHHLLVELGVCSKINIEIADLLMKYNIPCKITGSGNGGCMIVVCGWFRTPHAEFRKTKVLGLVHENFKNFNTQHVVLGNVNKRWSGH